MSGLASLLGDSLLNCDGGVVPVTSIDAKVIGLFFGAHWSGESRAFAAQLVTLYNAVEARLPGEFEVVYVSSDRDARNFSLARVGTPWLAIPYDESDTRDKLYDTFRFYDVPTLVFVRRDGSVLTQDGVGLVKADPNGEGFPWSSVIGDAKISKGNAQSGGGSGEQGSKPQQHVLLAQITDTKQLIDKEWKHVSDHDVLNHEHVMYYFSAAWCPPCQRFTPILASWYAHNRKTRAHDVEIVFVSADRSEQAFREYYRKMPWMAVRYGSPMIASLQSRFHVSYFPRLVVCDRAGNVVAGDAVSSLQSKPEEFPWPGAGPSPIAQYGGTLLSVAAIGIWIVLGVSFLLRMLKN